MRESELLSNGFLNKTGLPDLSLLKCDSMFGCFNFPTVWSTIFFQEKNYVFILHMTCLMKVMFKMLKEWSIDS